MLQESSTSDVPDVDNGRLENGDAVTTTPTALQTSMKSNRHTLLHERDLQRNHNDDESRGAKREKHTVSNGIITPQPNENAPFAIPQVSYPFTPPPSTSSIPALDHHNTTLQTLLTSLARTYSNPALHVTPAHTLYMSDTPIPMPSPTQVLIHVRATGICGSDLHLWQSGRIGPLTVDHDCVLGHEAAGVVVALGWDDSTDAANLRVGDRVAIEPGVPCERCWSCRSGQYNLCEEVRFCGVAGVGGTVRRFVCHEVRFVHRISRLEMGVSGGGINDESSEMEMDFKTGALLEPLSVVLHAVGRCGGEIGIGKPVLVCGAGPIGLIALKAVRAMGAWPIGVTDVDEARLEFARRFVPGCRTFLVGARGDDDEAKSCAKRIRTEMFGCGSAADEDDAAKEEEYKAPSVVLECTGVESSVVTAAYCCRRGGTVMVIGVGKTLMNNLPFMHISLAEVSHRPFVQRFFESD